MAGIYGDQHFELSDLLSRANNDQGATLLIPDLQRPYVWYPRQVILLVDSLIRGWPFGTLLTWKVGADDPVRELARSFWKVVDRINGNDGDSVSSKHPPASFQMVLDGQQRVQSLLLATSGDGWGFKMFDRDWHSALTNQKPRGRQGIKHWSLGCLCVDLEALTDAYSKQKRITALDYTQIVKWAVTGGKPAQSSFPKPTSYLEPLPRTDSLENKGRYIRFSRMWEAAPGADGIEVELAESLAEDLLKEHEATEDLIKVAIRPVGSLLMTLARVKKTRVTYLELAEFDEKLFTRESYNDAVVNIFTRLNTAGRTLTREDITFAWLKVGWESTQTGGRNAAQCFDDLAESLEPFKLKLGVEDLVAGLSFIWSTSHAEGRLLTNNDLLKGEAIRPMAADLSNNWSILTEAIRSVSEAVVDRGLIWHEHYDSLNSLFVLWAWQYAAEQWIATHSCKVPERDAYEKKISGSLDSFVDRWLMCSQWAGRWSSGSADTTAGYAKRLADCRVSLKAAPTTPKAAEILERFLDLEVKALEVDATGGVQGIVARKRDQVRVYYSPLWIWHRLDEDRWEKSTIPLRTSKRRKMNLDVDHAVAFALWSVKTGAQLPAGMAEQAEAINVINQIGNCSLLEKSFNISKSARTLKSFLNEVHEIKIGTVSLAEWGAALNLDASLMDVDAASVDEVVASINLRDALIRKELVEFVKGERTRVDLG